MVTSGSAIHGFPAGRGHMSDSLPRDPRRTLTSLGVVVYDWDLVSDRIEWGANAAEVMGFVDMSEWETGRGFARAVELAEGSDRAGGIVAATDRDDESGVPYAVMYGLRLGSGRLVRVDDAGRWFADAAGKPARAHGTMRLRASEPDETEFSRARAAFLGDTAADVTEAAGAKRPLTLFAIAIANLGELNEELGFGGADGVIDTVLVRMSATMRQRDRFVRYSGNRFALALRGCAANQAEVAAERLSRLVGDVPVGTAAGTIEVRLVIGAASVPDHATDAAMLLRRAEAGLGLAKRRAGAGFMMYDPRLFRAGARPGRREPLLDGIEMLNGRRIRLACQPVVEAGSRETAFSEGLLRVSGKDGRIRPAGDVVPALERAGLVHLADTRILELATEHLAANPQARLSVNVSPLTLDRPDWLLILSSHLGPRPDLASRLIVEVTETAAISDPDAMRRVLEAMKALGVAIAIDDFGAGHTSFRSLRSFPVDIVKIDGAFIQNLSRSPDDRFFVRTLVDLAHHLGIATVAEWVEDEETARRLHAWGVDYLQGDHCGRPELVIAADDEPTSRVA